MEGITEEAPKLYSAYYTEKLRYHKRSFVPSTGKGDNFELLLFLTFTDLIFSLVLDSEVALRDHFTRQCVLVIICLP